MQDPATALLVWGENSTTVAQWEAMTLGGMLSNRPRMTAPISSLPTMPRLYFEDGESMSVQAGARIYSTPQQDEGPYSHVEVGFPSFKPPDIWMPYAEEPETPMGTVYAYLPISLVELTIAAHGGIDRKKTFQNFFFRQFLS